MRARVTAGNAPTAVQMLGFDIRDWAEQGALGNLDKVASKEGWEKVIPAPLQEFAKYDGHWIAAPVNIHSTNWMWINKAALDKAGGKEPTNWDELIALLDNFKAQGITPIAHGGQPWQDATIFDAVVLSFGPDFYKKAFIDLDPEALGSDTMKQAFDRMSKLRTYVDDNFSGRDWNLASAMVIEGKAGVQFMGDWAKGEFLKAGKKPGEDFVCMRYSSSFTGLSSIRAFYRLQTAGCCRPTALSVSPITQSSGLCRIGGGGSPIWRFLRRSTSSSVRSSGFFWPSCSIRKSVARAHPAPDLSLSNGAFLHRDRNRMEMVSRSRHRAGTHHASMGMGKLFLQLDQEQHDGDLLSRDCGGLAVVRLRHGHVSRGASRRGQ